jgi:hypothetical protein
MLYYSEKLIGMGHPNGLFETDSNDPLPVTPEFIDKWTELTNKAIDALEELADLKNQYIGDWDEANSALKDKFPDNKKFIKLLHGKCKDCFYPEILHNQNDLCDLEIENAIDILHQAEEVSLIGIDLR